MTRYVCLLFGRAVCHNFFKGREVPLPCFYRNNCFILKDTYICFSLSSLIPVLNAHGFCGFHIISLVLTNDKRKQLSSKSSCPKKAVENCYANRPN